MKEIVDKIIEGLLAKDETRAVNQLGAYMLSGDPIYLPKELRGLDHTIDRFSLLEYAAKIMIDEYRNREE